MSGDEGLKRESSLSEVLCRAYRTYSQDGTPTGAPGCRSRAGTPQYVLPDIKTNPRHESVLFSIANTARGPAKELRA